MVILHTSSVHLHMYKIYQFLFLIKKIRCFSGWFNNAYLLGNASYSDFEHKIKNFCAIDTMLYMIFAPWTLFISWEGEGEGEGERDVSLNPTPLQYNN